MITLRDAAAAAGGAPEGIIFYFLHFIFGMILMS